MVSVFVSRGTRVEGLGHQVGDEWGGFALQCSLELGDGEGSYSGGKVEEAERALGHRAVPSFGGGDAWESGYSCEVMPNPVLE